MKRIFGLTAIAVATLNGCGSYSQSDQSLWRDAPNYLAMKSVLPPGKAYAYGEGTVLEFPQGGTPAWIRIKNATGESIPFEQVGRFIRIPQRLERLTAWVNGVPREFVVAGGTERIASVTMATPADVNPFTPVKPVTLERGSSATASDLRAELDEVKATIQKLTETGTVSAADWRPIAQRLDSLEARIADATAATVAVQFARGATAFKPTPEAKRLISNAIKGADSIHIKGFTDAKVAGPADPKIALGRAMSAKGYLVGEGANPSKIVTTSQADGGFVADNTTEEGRARNRRVEIQFVAHAVRSATVN